MARKNKGKFGKGKTTIEEQDEFVSGVTKLAEKLRPYAWRIAVLVVVVTVGVVSFTTYRWWKERKEKKATAEFVEALEVARRDIVPPEAKPDDPDQADPDQAKPDEEEEDKPITYETAEARAQAELDVLARLRSSYGSTGVGQEAKLVEASTLVELGKYDEAMSLYKAYASGAGSDLLRAIAREGIGYALEAKALAAKDATAREAGLREALAAFENVQPKEDGPRRDYALYHAGRILATLEENDKAVEAFEKVLAIEPPSPLADEVNARLAALQAVSSK